MACYWDASTALHRNRQSSPHRLICAHVVTDRRALSPSVSPIPELPHSAIPHLTTKKPNHGCRRRGRRRGRRREHGRRGHEHSHHGAGRHRERELALHPRRLHWPGLAPRRRRHRRRRADRLGEPCAAGDRAESDLVSFHVLAFACFLFSSLVALCLKQLVRTYPHRIRGSSAAGVVGRTARINRAALRVGILASAVGSVAGCGFLMMGLVNVVQVKLGRLGCGDGGSAAWAAVVPLVTLVPAAMLIYIGVVFYAFTS
ncbi:hypothetical protein PR202_ga27896 [Eleusine coracana subsp. coracana]|uniref:Uncharacterized protein n=1 Tax=Eleusine coracana subsp. coracana TaxID=191504 RepID=A0AAV5DI05_ELECO|nr:hypothetical protein PR202_ga27896 [Eleusine coracana subsp. coracana]